MACGSGIKAAVRVQASLSSLLSLALEADAHTTRVTTHSKLYSLYGHLIHSTRPKSLAIMSADAAVLTQILKQLETLQVSQQALQAKVRANSIRRGCSAR